MRILEVIPFFSPQMGGSAQAVYQISKYLGGQNHHVTVLTGDTGQADERFDEGPFEVRAFRTRFSGLGFYFTPGMIPWMRQNLARFEIVHLHLARSYQNIVVQSRVARVRIPFVISAHGTLPYIERMQTAKRMYDLCFGRRIASAARGWIAVSPAEVEQYRQAGIAQNRIRMIYNGLDLGEFNHLPIRGSFREKWLGLPHAAKVILYLGRIHRRKGIRYLLEAFTKLPPGKGGCILIVAGPDDGEIGFLKGYSRALAIERRVHFVGPLYGADRLAALVDADVLASPATNEIFGLVPFEALMCGTPVVVAGECGQGQLIESAGAGESIPFGDSDALAQSIQYILENRTAALEKVRSGQRFIREYLDGKATTKKLVEYYAEVVEQEKGETGGRIDRNRKNVLGTAGVAGPGFGDNGRVAR